MKMYTPIYLSSIFLFTFLKWYMIYWTQWYNSIMKDSYLVIIIYELSLTKCEYAIQTQCNPRWDLCLFEDIVFGLPKTCHEVMKSGGREGNHILDPEQDGFDPMPVFCNMSSDPVTAVLHHNLENVTYIHGYEGAGSYNAQVSYVADARHGNQCNVQRNNLNYVTWWRHQMETFAALLAICAGNSHKGQWRRALTFSLICVWINAWVNSREAGDLRRHRAHYDVIVMNPSRVSPGYIRDP